MDRHNPLRDASKLAKMSRRSDRRYSHPGAVPGKANGVLGVCTVHWLPLEVSAIARYATRANVRFHKHCHNVTEKRSPAIPTMRSRGMSPFPVGKVGGVLMAPVNGIEVRQAS